MNRSLNIRHTTAILLVVIAVLIGALAATVGITRQAPMYVATAHAATIADQVPLGSFAPLVKRVTPGVVNISSSRMVKNAGAEMPGGMLDDPIFRQFFGGRAPRMQPRTPRRAQSLGSGVVVSPDGFILTNNHVIEGATDVKVSFSDRSEYPAKVIGADPTTDIAVIKIDKTNLPVVPLSDSAKAQVGDIVLAVGNPFGIGQTVTMGIISATGRAGLGIERFEDFIQTDAPINPGNSGGALINTRGELVGINTAILSGETGGNQGIGFAIPANLARNVMDQIQKHGKVSHGYMGIVLDQITPDKAKAFGLGAGGHGVAVAEVQPDSPAAKAGLQAGDVITAMNGQPVDELQSFRFRVAGIEPDTRINLSIFRNGKTMDVPLTLGTFKLEAENGGANGPDENGLPSAGEKAALSGVSVQALTPDLRGQLQLPDNSKGVVITEVDPNSAAAQAGLEQGDLVVQVNRKPVNSAQQFNSAVRQGDSSGSTLLLVKRGPASKFVVVPNK